jgi:hypothetical protein
MSPDLALRRFVRELIAGSTATRHGDEYRIAGSRTAAPARLVLELAGSGALEGDGKHCRANASTRGWLRRAHLDAEPFAGQHRVVVLSSGGTQINAAESSLARLAVPNSDGDVFLGKHHLEAGERVRQLVERAHLQPRLTMSYSAAPVAASGHHKAAEISDLAADARRHLASIHRVLPRDCAGVVIDVRGLQKGLQQVERERQWPRRSAKLVLRIGLEQLAQHYGLGPFARGEAQAELRTWMDDGARPQAFG